MTELWELPDGWRWAEFRDVARVDSRLVDPSGYGAMPHIAPNHIESGTGRLLEHTTIAADKVFSGKHLFRAGHILYSKIRPYLAKAVRVDFEGLCSADMYPISTDMDARFLHRWLVSPMFTEQASRSQGRTVLPKINQDGLAILPVPVAPAHEQARIGAKLDALQSRSRRAKEALDAIPSLLERFRQSVLAAAFRGDLTADWRAENPDVEPASELLERIRIERRRRWEEAELARMQAKGKPPPDDRWKAKYEEPEPANMEGLPDLPEGWCWMSLDEVTTDARIGLVRSASEQSHSAPHPYVRMQHYKLSGEWDMRDVTRVEASEAEAIELELKAGDVLFNTRNSSELVGKVAIWPHGRPGHLFNNNLMRLRFVPSVHSQWAGSQMMSPPFRTRLSGSRSATTSVAAIYGRDLFRQAFAVAPLEEQLAAVAIVNGGTEALQGTRSAVEASRHRIDELDRATLAKAFRGELVPQDPNDEPAEAMLARLKAPPAAELESESSPSKPARSAGRAGRPRKP